MIYVFLANGFEECEAIAPIDCLRRAGKVVKTVGIGGKTITGAHQIPVIADLEEQEVVLDKNLEMIVLPGGMPGTLNLGSNETVQNAIRFCTEQNIWIGAICAAPTILGKMGLLKGRKAVCYPGHEVDMTGAKISRDNVCVDGKIITAKGAGVTFDFSLQLVEVLYSKDVRKLLAEKMICKK